MNHYVYHSYEEWGREYIGVRSCDCLPEEDTKYFGSFKDKTFNPTEKTILFVRETRQEAAEIEIELHDFFDVAVNPQFANQAKQTSTKFDTTGIPNTEEQKKAHSERMSGENNPMYGIPCTEEQKKKLSVANSGENHPQFGVPRTEEWKKAHSERMSGALHPRSKEVKVIQPDGTELHFGSGCEAARGLGIDSGSLRRYAISGHVLTKGPRKGWSFLFKNPEDF
jgi:hypothetical protein